MFGYSFGGTKTQKTRFEDCDLLQVLVPFINKMREKKDEFKKAIDVKKPAMHDVEKHDALFKILSVVDGKIAEFNLPPPPKDEALKKKEIYTFILVLIAAMDKLLTQENNFEVLATIRDQEKALLKSALNSSVALFTHAAALIAATTMTATVIGGAATFIGIEHCGYYIRDKTGINDPTAVSARAFAGFLDALVQLENSMREEVKVVVMAKEKGSAIDAREHGVMIGECFSKRLV